MLLRTIRLAASFAAVALLGACHGDGSPFEPLRDGVALPATLTTTSIPGSQGPEQMAVTAMPGALDVTWDLVSAPCLIASVSALQSGPVVEVRVHRSGEPLALCAAVQVHYRYVARVMIPGPGSYEVRLVDDMLGQPPRPVGRRSVSVFY